MSIKICKKNGSLKLNLLIIKSKEQMCFHGIFEHSLFIIRGKKVFLYTKEI